MENRFTFFDNRFFAFYSVSRILFLLFYAKIFPFYFFIFVWFEDESIRLAAYIINAKTNDVLERSFETKEKKVKSKKKWIVIEFALDFGRIENGSYRKHHNNFISITKTIFFICSILFWLLLFFNPPKKENAVFKLKIFNYFSTCSKTYHFGFCCSQIFI